MGDLREISLNRKFHTVWKVTSSAIKFEIKAPGCVAVGISRKPDEYLDYWITIAQLNRCWLDKFGRTMAHTVLMPNIINDRQFRGFWLTWYGGHVRFGADDSPVPWMSCENDIHGMTYITFSAMDHRHTVTWRVELSPVNNEMKVRDIKYGHLRWVTYKPNMTFPLQPLIGGYEKEVLYLARALHAGVLTPGKFVPSTGKAYIIVEGRVLVKSECQILCGFDAFWLLKPYSRVQGGEVLVAQDLGYMRSEGVARATCDGHLIPGKVPKSAETCHIVYQGKEIASRTYEVLVRRSLRDTTENIFVKVVRPPYYSDRRDSASD